MTPRSCLRDFGRFMASTSNQQDATPRRLGLSGLLGDLNQWMSDETTAEIYLSAGSGSSRLDHNGLRTPLLLPWSDIEISEFLLELTLESDIRLDPFKPFAGGVIPGCSWRWHAIIPPMAPDGPIVVLRRQRFDTFGLNSFVLENLSVKDLRPLILSGSSLLIYGATGSGKTSLLVAILREIFFESRVGIAESVAEIPLLSSYWFRLVEVAPDTAGRGGVDFNRVVAEIMRLSPEILVMGELRGREAALLPDFARTGHGGILATIHAGSSADARDRLEIISGRKTSEMPPLVGLRVWRDQSRTIRVRRENINGAVL